MKTHPHPLIVHVIAGQIVAVLFLLAAVLGSLLGHLLTGWW